MPRHYTRTIASGIRLLSDEQARRLRYDEDQSQLPPIQWSVSARISRRLPESETWHDLDDLLESSLLGSVWMHHPQEEGENNFVVVYTTDPFVSRGHVSYSGHLQLLNQRLGVFEKKEPPKTTREIVLKELEDPRFDYRTVKGIHEATGLSSSVIQEAIRQMGDDGEVFESIHASRSGTARYGLRRRFRKESPLWRRLLAAFRNSPD